MVPKSFMGGFVYFVVTVQGWWGYWQEYYVDTTLANDLFNWMTRTKARCGKKNPKEKTLFDVAELSTLRKFPENKPNFPCSGKIVDNLPDDGNPCPMP